MGENSAQTKFERRRATKRELNGQKPKFFSTRKAAAEGAKRGEKEMLVLPPIKTQVQVYLTVTSTKWNPTSIRVRRTAANNLSGVP